MLMTRNDRPRRTPRLASFDQAKPGCDQTAILLKGVRAEAMADAAVKFSGRLDRMATYVANEGLSAAEIVELMRQESEQFAHQAEAGKCM